MAVVANYRMMTAMLLFRFEQELGRFVSDRSTNLSEIKDIADSVAARESIKRKDLTISTTAQLVVETYLEDLFQLAIRITENSTDHPIVLGLKNVCAALSLNDIRNAVCHPNRPFPECYWFRMAAIASDPSTQQLEFNNLTGCLESAITGRIEPPPEEWLVLPNWTVTNNLPASNDFEITGLIGRPKESKELQKFLLNPRVSSLAVVAPGGVGKTALALDVLEKLCKTPEFNATFDAVVFVSLKLERLTASGLVKIDAPTSIQEIEAQLTEIIPRIIDGSAPFKNLSDIRKAYGDRKLLLFIDNLETLLRDDPTEFNEFQMGLPVAWRVLVTSRVTINSATCLSLGPLAENNAKHLARIYATRRNASGLMNDSSVEKIVQRTRYNPLAIRLGVDAYVLGSQLEDALDVASRDVLAFSYTNLLEVISNESTAVLECLFLQDPQSRIELAENLGVSIDMVAKGLGELTRTSLILRNNENREEIYSLYPAIRDLLLINPRDTVLRAAVQEKIYQRREAILGHESRQENLSPFRIEYVDSGLPAIVRNVCFEANSIIKSLYRDSSPEQALRVLERLRTLKVEYPHLTILPRSIARLHAKMGDTRTAMAELIAVRDADPNDIQSLQLLGRLAYDEHDHKLSLSTYDLIKQYFGWDPQRTDDATARYCYNGYLIALLYSGSYPRIIDETASWAQDAHHMDLSGVFRARALKRSVENSSAQSEKTETLFAAASILDQISTRYGYPRWSYACFQEVIDGIAVCARAPNFPSANKADSLLRFAERHLNSVFGDKGQDRDEVLRLVSTFREVRSKSNPFLIDEWRDFLATEGGQVYVDAEFKDSLKQDDYVQVKVYHVKPHPSPSKNGPLFVFAEDENKLQYFIHPSVLGQSSRPMWAAIEEGTELAIRAEKTSKSYRATEAHIV